MPGTDFKFDAPTEPPPPQVDDEIRRREEEELQRVLEMSMHDKGGRQQWAGYSAAAASNSNGAGASGSTASVHRTAAAPAAAPAPAPAPSYTPAPAAASIPAPAGSSPPSACSEPSPMLSARTGTQAPLAEPIILICDSEGTSQRRTVPSLDPESRLRPFEMIDVEVTPRVCPRKLRAGVIGSRGTDGVSGGAAGKMERVKSEDAVNSTREEGKKRSEVTVLR